MTEGVGAGGRAGCDWFVVEPHLVWAACDPISIRDPPKTVSSRWVTCSDQTKDPLIPWFANGVCTLFASAVLAEIHVRLRYMWL